MEADELGSGDVIMKLSKDEALVLFEWLSRQEDADLNLAHLVVEDLGEREVLWRLIGALEQVLAEPFLADYGDLVAAALSRLRPVG